MKHAQEVEGWALDEGNRITQTMSLNEATYVTVAKGLQRQHARSVRIIKPQPENGTYCPYHEGVGSDRKARVCPHGKVGKRLWVRETWAIGVSTGNSWHSEDGPIRTMHEPWRYQRRYRGSGESGFCGKWRPSLLMPRWACRLVLELTEVRVERLQEISEADAQAEGAAFVCELCGCDLDTDHGAAVHFACDDPDCERASHREGFRRLWESINGAGSWALNPWVWVLEFREVKNG